MMRHFVCLHSECKTQRTDVVFVVDSFRSITLKDYKELKGILASMVADLNIGPDAVQVGLIQFGRDVVTEFGLTNYTSREELKQAIIGMQRIKGKSGTNIPDAVKAGVDLLREDGRNVTKWLVLFTDGRSTMYSSTTADTSEGSKLCHSWRCSQHCCWLW